MNEIGFGDFWAIRSNVIPKSLGMQLLENYDCCGSFLNLSNRRILEFTKEDVHAILWLPMGHKKIEEGKTCDSCEKYNALLDSDHGDEVKRDFIVYVISTCIKGNQNGDAYFMILKSFGNVTDIINFDWCEYVISPLRAIVFKRRSDPVRLFRDPLIFWMGVTLERWFPTAISWTKAEVQKRMDNEEKMSGMFCRDAIRRTFDYDKVVQAAEADLQQYFQDLECEQMQKDNARVSLKVSFDM
ncbi:hypothetical protein Cgig2_008293 [Carnegiea gigantea]|uniref:Uncharacterized protein n=1 Tax=Carnegiea gigantea TaxID=171969 RepID=A0A9Q1H073_9CARY|nr:hypothetical protein Cgig2_008293 [Carnegiea gigantea]